MSVNKVDKTTGNTSLLAGSTLWADSPIGSILPYGGASAPSGWFLCNGSAISRTTYAELFAVIGTSFGSGDGSTTFNLPDMRESVPKGAGLTGKTVGAHLDADGLAVGEFLDDRIKAHNHNLTNTIDSITLPAAPLGKNPGTNSSLALGDATWDSRYASLYINDSGSATNEVKSVGVNYIIKAKMVAMPSDFMSKVDEAINENATSPVSTSNKLITEGYGNENFIRYGFYQAPEGDTYKRLMIHQSSYLNGKFSCVDRSGNEYVITIKSGTPTSFCKVNDVNSSTEIIKGIRFYTEDVTKIHLYIHSNSWNCLNYHFLSDSESKIDEFDSDLTEYNNASAITWTELVTKSDITKVHFPWNTTDNTDTPTITVAVPAGKCLSGTFYFHNSNSQVQDITAYSEQVHDGYQIARVLGGQGMLSLSVTYVNDTNASVNIYIQARYVNASLNAYCYNYMLS